MKKKYFVSVFLALIMGFSLFVLAGYGTSGPVRNDSDLWPSSIPSRVTSTSIAMPDATPVPTIPIVRVDAQDVHPQATIT